MDNVDVQTPSRTTPVVHNDISADHSCHNKVITYHKYNFYFNSANIFLFQLPSVDTQTPLKNDVTCDENHGLYYTDSQAYSGPMTQMMKANLPSCNEPDNSANTMHVDDNNFDSAPLPNLNESFSDIAYDGFDQISHQVRL